MKRKKIALMGNPNVGKSTVFNEITGSHQHTGNWIGKTVDSARGHFTYKYIDYELIDLPGTYSLISASKEEEIARDYLCFEEIDCVIVVVDSTMLLKNLNLVYQITEVCSNVILLLNMTDEAKKRNITIDKSKLEGMLNIPVVKSTARSGKGVNELLEQIHLICTGQKEYTPDRIFYGYETEKQISILNDVVSRYIPNGKCERFFSLRLIENDTGFSKSFKNHISDIKDYERIIKRAKRCKSEISINSISKQILESTSRKAIKTASECVTTLPSKKERFDDAFDRLLLGKGTSILIMLIMLGVVLWITIIGSNYPSEILRGLFDRFEIWCYTALNNIGAPTILTDMLVNGILRVLLWVVAVMLPPMTIFFPLFSILEEAGILPRFAFNLDRPFERCGACGKQALCTCMGLGCNAVGVTGCRIIDSPRERLIAIITNSLTPCNGRFPLLIAIISMFFCKNSIGAATMLLGFLVLSICMTFVSSKALSKSVLKGKGSSVIMELPSYKSPRIFKIIKDTIREKVLFVLLRAIVVAAPAGLVIWLLANITVNGASLLATISDFLDPFGRIIGLDGVMLLAFILSFPANEITIPIALMTYLSTNELCDYSSLNELKTIFTDNGWTTTTALCTCIFSLFHFPCSTTLITIYKETKSVKWTFISVIVPLICGVALCGFVNLISHL